MKIKPLHWIIIISLAVIVPLIFIFVITRIIINPPKSWWWFFGVLIAQITIGAISGIIILIVKLNKEQPVNLKLNPKTAKEKAIQELKNDEHNPDNFEIESQTIMRVGESTAKRTSVLWLSGRGSELNESIDCIINLDNPDFEATWLRKATESKIMRAIKLMAENPETEEIQQTQTGLDSFGRAVQTTTVRRVSQREKEEKEEQKEAEMQNVL